MFGWFKKRQPLFVGTWLLIQAGGQLPETMGILSMRLVINPDGTLLWESQMRGPWDGMTLRGNGNWSAVGDRITYSHKEQSSTSVIRVEGARLVLEPDFILVRDGSVPIVGIYDKTSEAEVGIADGTISPKP